MVIVNELTHDLDQLEDTCLDILYKAMAREFDTTSPDYLLSTDIKVDCHHIENLDTDKYNWLT